MSATMPIFKSISLSVSPVRPAWHRSQYRRPWRRAARADRPKRVARRCLQAHAGKGDGEDAQELRAGVDDVWVAREDADDVRCEHELERRHDAERADGKRSCATGDCLGPVGMAGAEGLSDERGGCGAE